MSLPALLFDLDGTLTDSRLGIVRSIRYSLERLGGACPADDALASFIGPPLRDAFATLLATTDRGLVERAMALYRERYGSVGLHENTIYEGVPALLAGLRRAGSRLFVVTGKPTVFAEPVVQRLGLRPHFDGVFGPELGGRFDNKIDLVAHLVSAEGIDAATAVMIGDRAADVVAAKANGLRAVGALWGYGSEAELQSAGADTLCAAPAGLAACLARLA